ncbi:MAG: DUF1080 domain-containing protein [Oceanicoccus sp.]
MIQYVVSVKLIAMFFLFGIASFSVADEKSQWMSLFNGKDLDGWVTKIRYYPLGENPSDTFRVEDGLLTVSYEGYEKFEDKFGHLIYKTPYSHYRFRMQYRFVGEQAKGGAGWAFRNSGIMIHGQDPASMGQDQEFPVSIEVQLLGGGGTWSRSTANMCSPGTHIEMKGKTKTRHCIDSTSKTFHGDQWVNVEVEVRGNDSIKHFVNDELVMEYHRPQLDSSDKEAKPLIEKASGNIMLSSGYISLQSESHPIQFRKIELQLLPHNE